MPGDSGAELTVGLFCVNWGLRRGGKWSGFISVRLFHFFSRICRVHKLQGGCQGARARAVLLSLVILLPKEHARHPLMQNTVGVLNNDAGENPANTPPSLAVHSLLPALASGAGAGDGSGVSQGAGLHF